jgi:hypothetical protein
LQKSLEWRRDENSFQMFPVSFSFQDDIECQHEL